MQKVGFVWGNRGYANLGGIVYSQGLVNGFLLVLTALSLIVPKGGKKKAQPPLHKRCEGESKSYTMS